jgi:uncharacterized alkaline shock family protein YloU
VTEKEKKNDLGVLKINNEVIASIARNAALQVNGVQSVKRGMFSLVMDLFSKGYNYKGITLDISESDVKIGVTIVVRYGINIPDVSGLVQENIRTAIEEMTGLSVIEVNVNIADIHSEEPEN